MPDRKGRHGLDTVRAAIHEAGSDAHYLDPAFYSKTYASRFEDVDYYCALATESGGPVLEYGTGNGRLALPIARAGVAITGVDRSRPMLADLRAQLKGESPGVRQRLRLRRGDMRSVRLKQRFPLVLCTFNTFLHLYTRQDVERFCARVCAHLKPRGRFVVDVSQPDAEELCRSPSKAYRAPRFRHVSTGEMVRYAERFHYDSLSQVLTIDMEYTPSKAPERRWATPLSHRQFFPQELEALLHYNGLRVVDVQADFRRQPPTMASRSLIYHCMRR